MSEDKLLNSEYQFNMDTSTQLLVSSVGFRRPGILVIKQSYLWTSLKDHRHGKSMHFGLTNLSADHRDTLYTHLLQVSAQNIQFDNKITLPLFLDFCPVQLYDTNSCR